MAIVTIILILYFTANFIIWFCVIADDLMKGVSPAGAKLENALKIILFGFPMIALEFIKEKKVMRDERKLQEKNETEVQTTLGEVTNGEVQDEERR